MCIEGELAQMESKDFFYIIAIMIAAGISIWNAINHHKTNKKTAFINTVTSERVKWLDKLRHNISSFCGLTHTWTRSLHNGHSEEFRLLEEIDKLRYLIRLQLNPKDNIDGQPNTDKRIEALITEIPQLTDESDRKKLDQATEDLILESQSLLKEEWDKVKLESKSGDLNSSTIGFGDSISICMSKFFDFKGRASRPEYWWFYLFTVLISWGSILVDPTEVLFGLVSLVLFFPVLTVGARRLHDTNRSGWWQLLWLTVIGGILVIVWQASEGKKEENKYDKPI